MLIQYGFGLTILQTCVLSLAHGKSATIEKTAKSTTVHSGSPGKSGNGGTTTAPLWTFGTLWELFGGANQTTWTDLTTPTMSPTSFETTTTKDIELILRNAKIIPDVIDKKPPHELYVSFYHHSWNFGQVFDVTDVNEAPHHLWWISEPKTYYTLLLISQSRSLFSTY